MDSIRRHITGAHKGEKREGIRRELDPEEQKKVEALEVKGLSWNEMYHIIYPEKAVAGGNEGSVAGGNEGSVAGGNEGSVASEREGSVARAEGICEDGDRTGGELWHYYYYYYFAFLSNLYQGDYQAEVDWMHNWLLASENEGSVASEREGSVARAKSICEDGDRTSGELWHYYYYYYFAFLSNLYQGDYQAEVDWMHNWLLAAPSNAIPGRLAPPTPTPSTYWAKIEGYVAGYTQTYYRSLRKRFKNAATIEDFRQVLGEVDRFYHDISDTASNASGEEG